MAPQIIFPTPKVAFNSCSTLPQELLLAELLLPDALYDGVDDLRLLRTGQVHLPLARITTANASTRADDLE